MRMLTNFINRGGKGLSASRQRELERAKNLLRKPWKRRRLANIKRQLDQPTAICSAGFFCSFLDNCPSGALMNRHMLGLVAPDEVLWCLPRSVMDLPFEGCVGRDLLDDDSSHPAGGRIPPHVIADLERLRHCDLLKTPLRSLSALWPACRETGLLGTMRFESV